MAKTSQIDPETSSGGRLQDVIDENFKVLNLKGDRNKIMPGKKLDRQTIAQFL